MGRWEISKSFDFCYGHRVHTQVLDTELSCNAKCKCRHQHGHQGLISVFLEGDKLNEQGMIIDFVELNWFKKWIDDFIDHKMILDISDPALSIFYPLFNKFSKFALLDSKSGCFTIKSEILYGIKHPEVEIYEGLVLVPFVPTSENLAKWFYGVVQDKLQGLATVSKIEFYETPKSKSVYYG